MGRRFLVFRRYSVSRAERCSYQADFVIKSTETSSVKVGEVKWLMQTGLWNCC
jgi:hypothetical protein